MRKKIIASIILCAILLSIGMVQAATGTVNLTATKTSVKSGETFTVTLSATCEDGINGMDTTYNYDQSKLELVSANVANNNWANLGLDNSITVISNTTSKITSDNIYVLTFKVKDGVAIGTTTISTGEIMIDSDLAQNSSFTVSAKSVNINITSDNNTNGEEGSTNGGNGTGNVGNTTNTNQNASSQNIKATDNTMSTKTKLPKAGSISGIFMIAVGIMAVIAIYSFIRIKAINKDTKK